MSHILIRCKDNAKPEENILRILTEKPQFIKLKPGLNTIDVKDYPDLKFGFRTFLTRKRSAGSRNEMCEDIIEMDLSHFDCSAVKSTANMCYDMISLEKVILPTKPFSNLEQADYMFGRCDKLKEIIGSLENVLSSAKLTSAKGMFYMTAVKKLALANCQGKNLKNIVNLCVDCRELEEIDLCGWNLRGVKINDGLDCGGMFDDCTSLQKIYLCGCNRITFDKILKEIRESNGVFYKPNYSASEMQELKNEYETIGHEIAFVDVITSRL